MVSLISNVIFHFGFFSPSACKQGKKRVMEKRRHAYTRHKSILCFDTNTPTDCDLLRAMCIYFLAYIWRKQKRKDDFRQRTTNTLEFISLIQYIIYPCRNVWVNTSFDNFISCACVYVCDSDPASTKWTNSLVLHTKLQKKQKCILVVCLPVYSEISECKRYS